MPIRCGSFPSIARAGVVGGSSSCEADNDGFVVNGICLTTRQAPKRNDYLEAMLTGRYSAFNLDPNETVRLYSGNDSEEENPRECYYTAIWNLAVEGIRQGKRPHDVSIVLRTIRDSEFPSTVEYLIDNLLLTSDRTPGSVRRGSDPRNPQAQPVHPAVTDSVLKVLAEEGILEEDARIAVSALIRNGTLRPGNLKEGGPLFVYGNDRRHIVSRVLNYISASRENQQVSFIRVRQ